MPVMPLESSQDQPLEGTNVAGGALGCGFRWWGSHTDTVWSPLPEAVTARPSGCPNATDVASLLPRVFRRRSRSCLHR
jgi:hypothetical protein